MWTFYTADRMQMHLWTRKRRLKFRKRWRKQHGGTSFRWYKMESAVAIAAYPELEGQTVILHVRDEQCDAVEKAMKRL